MTITSSCPTSTKEGSHKAVKALEEESKDRDLSHQWVRANLLSKPKEKEKSKYSSFNSPYYFHRTERDAQLLANRIALLKQEEMKTWKKIEETKRRANEVIRLKQKNEERVHTKLSAAK